MKNMRIVLSLVLSLLLVCVATQAYAAWPNRTINVVIPYGAGGGTDTVTRTYAKLMEKRLGVTVNCFNRTGAAGGLAMDLVASKPADGYWWLGIGLFQREMRVQGVTKLIGWKDWQYYKCANGMQAWAVTADSPFKTLTDFINAARKNPGKYKISSGSMASNYHQGNALLMRETKIDARTIHYKGGAPSVLAGLQGEVDVIGAGLHEEIEFIRAGKLRSLAVFAKEPIRLKDGTILRPVGDYAPGLAKFAPFGTEYTPALKRGTPIEILEKFKKVFIETVNSSEFDAFLKSRFFFKEIVLGEEADRMAALRESASAWLLWDLKLPGAKVNPADLGIPRPEDFDSWWPPKGYKPRGLSK